MTVRTRFHDFRIAVVLMTAWSAVAAAQTHDHGEGAPASPHTGVVSFENSGAAAAQRDFLYGLAQLHNFQYDAAAGAFRRAQQIDPGFAMAYWGEAMTYDHPVWAQQDLEAARTALQKLASTAAQRRAKAPTEREKAYLDAVEILFGEGDKFDRDRRYSLAMERVHNAWPRDVDATCFYALSLLGTAHAVRDVPTYMRSAALMEEVFEQNPQHPGAAHYLIHSVDDAAHAPLGLRAADAYGKIAPDSTHALHMTSHIYLALGMWQRTVAANEAVMKLMERNVHRADPDRPIPACGHAQLWLGYGYLQQERLADSRRIVDACGDEMRQREYRSSGADLLAAEGSAAGVYFAMRARHLIDAEKWDDPLAQVTTDRVELPFAEFSRDFADAYGIARHGELRAARTAVTRAKRSAERLVAAGTQEGLAKDHPQQLVPGIEIDQLEGLLLLKQGRTDQAIELLSRAANAEKTLPMDFGPPSLHKPANELLGEVLLEAGRAQQARQAFDAAQMLAPGRTRSLRGLAECARRLNDRELAASVNAKLDKTVQEARAAQQM